jgi:uncharacterized protein (TIGR02453 family)
MPHPDALAKIRAAIAAKPAAWKKIESDADFAKQFGGIHGEALTRPPRGFAPDHPFIEDIKKKSFFASHDAVLKLAASPKLVEEIAASFRAASPLMKFLCGAVGVPY